MQKFYPSREGIYFFSGEGEIIFFRKPLLTTHNGLNTVASPRDELYFFSLENTFNGLVRYTRRGQKILLDVSFSAGNKDINITVFILQS